MGWWRPPLTSAGQAGPEQGESVTSVRITTTQIYLRAIQHFETLGWPAVATMGLVTRWTMSQDGDGTRAAKCLVVNEAVKALSTIVNQDGKY